MLNDDAARGGRFSVLRFFAQTLVPCLSERMASEQAAASGSSCARGYQKTGDNGSLERSSAHQAWCSVLMMAAGLVRQLPVVDSASGSGGGAVWEFVASSETLLTAALNSSMQLSRAVVDEQACVLTFLNVLSSAASRRKQWREMLTTNCLVLMEQSRLVLRRACVLLGNSTYALTRRREQQISTTTSSQMQHLQKKPRRLSVTAWPLASAASPRSPLSLSTSSSLLLPTASSASLTFARQTLLHEHLSPSTPRERRDLAAFYGEMETKLVHVVEQATHLLVKWTPSVVSRAATVSVHGTRLVDDEQLIPLLAMAPPSDSLVMSCEPSVGHLCLAMEFCVDQLTLTAAATKTTTTTSAMQVAVNVLQTSALLLLKTYLIHVDQYQQQQSTQHHTQQLDKTKLFQDQQSELATFVEQLVNELSESREVTERRELDLAFLQQILQVIQLKLN